MYEALGVMSLILISKAKLFTHYMQLSGGPECAKWVMPFLQSRNGDFMSWIKLRVPRERMLCANNETVTLALHYVQGFTKIQLLATELPAICTVLCCE